MGIRARSRSQSARYAQDRSTPNWSGCRIGPSMEAGIAPGTAPDVRLDVSPVGLSRM